MLANVNADQEWPATPPEVLAPMIRAPALPCSHAQTPTHTHKHTHALTHTHTHTHTHMIECISANRTTHTLTHTHTHYTRSCSVCVYGAW